VTEGVQPSQREPFSNCGHSTAGSDDPQNWQDPGLTRKEGGTSKAGGTGDLTYSARVALAHEDSVHSSAALED